MRVIYDFGANSGDNIPYYLLKAERVVAVEANPALCDAIRSRFPGEVDGGRLVVENAVLTDEEAGEVDFYVNTRLHVLSRLPPPPAEVAAEFERVVLPSRTPVDIIGEHGPPHFVKVDVEGMDEVILRSMHAASIVPPYVSSEAHTIGTFAALSDMGYPAFKLVEGTTVGEVYGDAEVETSGGRVRHAFASHSAGPFGNDVRGGWMSAERFLELLALEGLGWRDIHASRIDAPDPDLRPSLLSYARRQAVTAARRRARSLLRRG